MDEIVNKWSAELDSAVKEFSKQAGEVAAWDRVLLKGGDEVSLIWQQVAARFQLGTCTNLRVCELSRFPSCSRRCR